MYTAHCTVPRTCRAQQIATAVIVVTSLGWHQAFDSPAMTAVTPSLMPQPFLTILQKPPCLRLCCSLHQEQPGPLVFSLITAILQAPVAPLYPPGSLPQAMRITLDPCEPRCSPDLSPCSILIPCLCPLHPQQADLSSVIPHHGVCSGLK